MVCKIADFIVEFKNPSPSMRKILEEYSFDGNPQLFVEVTDDEIELARAGSNGSTTALQAELAAFYTKLLAQIPLYGAFFLHASLIDVNGVGVAFTALSGTGKSTHTLLWQRLLGEKMQIINGDKPIIRFENDIPYGYGTPWNGKEHLGKNAKTPIKHLCFIERSEQNSCEKISCESALKGIFNQLFIPSNPSAALKTLELLDRLFKSVSIWIIKCNTDISAAVTSYNTIFEGEIK